MLSATALTILNDRKVILASYCFARLLADGDQFSSLFFSRQKAISITRRLLMEMLKSSDPVGRCGAFMDSMVRTGDDYIDGRKLFALKSGRGQIPGHKDPEWKFE
ncbi:MAG: hypothetical protein CML73_03320 [Rhodobiaceae bacterium]|nr:hypothetical protein [Rhodobiaceae bacterium]